MKKILAIAFFAGTCVATKAQIPQSAYGSIRRFENFASKYVTPRHVDVWLPDGYSNRKKYAVLYMHDGQMLFDSSINWNKQEWGVDETVSLLINQHKIKNCIVVGVWNSGAERWPDYTPQRPFSFLPQTVTDSIYKFTERTNPGLFNNKKIQSDNYLKFLVRELKPFIDKSFSTRPDRANTFIAGSSMGGLISLYAICEYPDVFGGAACLSTHWPVLFTVVDNPMPGLVLKYLKKRLPDPVSHSIYFDYGTQGVDSLYKPFQLQADALMKQRGYSKKNWMTRAFVGEGHTENAWRKRFALPVSFLLQKK